MRSSSFFRIRMSTTTQTRKKAKQQNFSTLLSDLYVKRQPKRHSNKNKIKVQKENEAKKEVLKSDLRLFKFLLHFSVWLREFRDSVQIDIDPVYYINAHLCPTIELCIFFSVLFCRWFIFNSLFVPFAWITIAWPHCSYNVPFNNVRQRMVTPKDTCRASQLIPGSYWTLWHRMPPAFWSCQSDAGEKRI